MIRSVRFNARAIVVAAVFAFPVFGQVADGDVHYARRAEGAQGARAASTRIDAAIAAYERAIAGNGGDIVAHARLLRAIRFKGAHAAASLGDKKAVYAEAKKAGDRALSAVTRALGARGVKASAIEKTVAAAVRAIPGAADVYLWDAVNWGEWALAYGKMAAVREGAADRIRRHATIAHLADLKLEGGAPARVLGRLHDQTPRVPFLTGWASANDAVKYLEQSSSFDPSNKLTLLFLAEAMVAADASSKPKAIEILRRVIGTPVHPDYSVEDAQAQVDARKTLAGWGAR